MASSIPSRIYLISKWGDVALGLSTGVFAYYLYEKKLNRTREDSLIGLIDWKLDQRRQREAAESKELFSRGGGGEENHDTVQEWEEALTKELKK